MKTNTNPSGNKMLLRWIWREIWSGQLLPVIAALVLVITCVVALSALAIRVEKVMTDQSRSLIAADLVFKSASPTATSLLDNSTTLGLTKSVQTRFSTMAFSDTELQLVSVKAVQDNYPLLGDLELQGKDGVIQHQVHKNELWISERLISLLKVKIGDILAIGDAELAITGVIKIEPEVNFNPFRSTPSVLISQADVQKTGVLQLGSRVEYRTFFNGDDKQLQKLQDDYTLQADQSWSSERKQDRTTQLIGKAKQYLSLSIVMVLLMAALTLILTCRHYTDSRTSTVAMLKSMGASRYWLRKWFFTQITLIFACALIIGSFLGAGLEFLLRLPLHDLLPADLPSYGWQPFAIAFLVAVLIGFPALGIPLKRLLDTPAIKVMQANADTKEKTKGWWMFCVPIVAFLLFFGDSFLVWILSMGLVVLFAVVAVLSYGLLSLFSRGKWGPAMTLALSRIKRSPKSSMMQLAALSGSLMLITVLWLVRTDLLGDWQTKVPADAANVFALNIAPSEQVNYLQFLDNNKLPRSNAYPIIRGRLTDINGESALTVAEKLDKKPRILQREINFTWRDSLPVDNKVLAGTWTDKGGVSIEQSIAEELAIKIGDELIFSVNSQIFSAKVNSIREVEWQNMKPNFYFIFTPDIIANLPATWLVSFKIDDKQVSLINQLARQYPTVSLLDLRNLIGKIQSILVQVSWSLSVLAGLGVISGVLLIFTLLRLSLKQRQSEITLYRTLGTSRKLISRTLWSEYGLIAITAGLVAVVGAELIAFSLMKWGLSLTPSFHPLMWILLPAAAMIIIYLSLRSVVNQLLKPLK